MNQLLVEDCSLYWQNHLLIMVVTCLILTINYLNESSHIFFNQTNLVELIFLAFTLKIRTKQIEDYNQD
jgi:hypothetical protein